jgi:hypothetical protein
MPSGQASRKVAAVGDAVEQLSAEGAEMQREIGRRLLTVGVGIVVVAVGAMLGKPARGRSEGAARPDQAAVERTRETVRMIDDLYKGAVVHITATYVKASERTPAAVVAKKVFKHMEEKGWHKARLIDATGTPTNKANVARTDFEKRAVEEIRKGTPYVDEVAAVDGKPVLRAATVVPVVMKQCISCHPGLKEGEVIGALVYELPIK